MRFIILKSYKTCESHEAGQCPYDFGCGARMEYSEDGTQEVERLALSSPYLGNGKKSIHSVDKALTLINEMRDICINEPSNSKESIELFLGAIDHHKVEKILCIGDSEDRILGIAIEGELDLLIHPNPILRELGSRI